MGVVVAWADWGVVRRSVVAAVVVSRILERAARLDDDN